MAARFITSNETRETSSGVATTSAFDTSGANFLVAVTVSAESAVACAITDSKGNTWASLTAQAVVGQARVQIHYAENATVGSGHTVTATAASGIPALQVWAFSGVATSSAFDQQNGANANAATISTGSITPTNANALIITAFYSSWTNLASYIDSNTGYAQTNQLTQQGGVNYGCMSAYAVQGASAVATSVTWRQAGGGVCAAAIASFNTPASSSASGGAYAFAG